MKTNNTLSIKAKFSNAVHKIVEPNIGVKRRDLWQKQYQDKYKFTDAQKLQMMNEILILHRDCSNELNSMFYKRRYKRAIQEARIARGVKPKKKTSKEEYERQLKVA
jgi:hypothetical protein